MNSRAWGAIAAGGWVTLIASCGLVIDPDALVSGNAGAPVIGVEAGSSCTPTGPEVCNDGIDNDCNGSTDCADPACSEGFTCVDAAPEGWTLVLLAERQRPACPPGYPASTDVQVLPGDSAFTCTCDCGNNCGAAITLTTSTDATCATPIGSDTFQIDPTKCTTKALDLPSGFSSATSGSAACTAKDTVTSKADLLDGRTCGAPPRVGEGCPGSLRCVPKATGWRTCVVKMGPSACPEAVFTRPWRSGTAADDQRTCTGCSCDAKPCSVELELWSHPVCQGPASVTVTSSCAANGASDNLKSYKSTATNGCTPATPSTPQGSIVFQNEQTICCK